MKLLLIFVILIALSSCANSKTTTSTNKSVETITKEAFKKGKLAGDKLPQIKYPNSMDTTGTSPEPNKSGNLERY